MSDTTNERVATMSELAQGAEVSRHEESQVRLFHLDAQRRLKLRWLLLNMYPVSIDTWREGCNFAVLMALGYWPFSVYMELSTSRQSLAAARPGRYDSGVRWGQVAAGRRGAGTIVTATRISLHAQASGEHAHDFTRAAEGAQTVCAGTLNIIAAVVRPKAPPAERYLTSLPEGVTGVPIVPCDAIPSSIDPGGPGADERVFESSAAPPRVLWGMQHTDANISVMGGEYLFHAEDAALGWAREAGLSPARLRFYRAQLLLKRGFQAGEEAVLRGRLTFGPDGKRTRAFITFHAQDAQGSVDPRPAIEVHLDSEA